MSGKPSKSKGTTKTLVVSRRERTNEEEEQIKSTWEEKIINISED